MKRSEINALLRAAEKCFRAHGWVLPPRPRWDVTDFGLGDWRKFGLVLINLAAEPEYCEKLMYAKKKMVTPCHCHHKKKEDIICRAGELWVRAWPAAPEKTRGKKITLSVNGEKRKLTAGAVLRLRAGERVTLPPPVYHAFEPASAECIIGEVSTRNDDLNDNFFTHPGVGRFPEVVENEPRLYPLVSDKP